jgi:hypothetical protein
MQNKRISAVIPSELYDDIKKLCESSSRSVNYMISKLLTQAIKEKIRKSGKKQNHTEHHTSN